MEMNQITVSDADLRKGAEEGMDAFLKVFIDKYLEVTGGKINADTMPLLNGYQHTLLGYHFFREEVMEGGFVQLIQNGYGPYIFDNPFAKAMRMFGAKEFSKLIYEAKKFTMPIVRIWKRNAQKRNSWPCMSNMRLLMTWKNNIWKRKSRLPHR